MHFTVLWSAPTQRNCSQAAAIAAVPPCFRSRTVFWSWCDATLAAAGERTINDTAMRRAADLVRERTNRDYLTSQAASFEHLSAHPNDWGTEKVWYLMARSTTAWALSASVLH